MSLQIHRAVRADRLVDGLGDLLAIPLADPFATEVVAVPTQGVERWLAQHLSHRLGVGADGRDGVCAGVDFPSPRRLVAAAVGPVLGLDQGSDPWQPRHAVWPLLEVLERSRGRADAAPLWSFLGEDRSGQGRRWTTAQHLAQLFATYAENRPHLVLDWLAGRDVDASGRPLPTDFAWQPPLWRALREAIDAPSPAERTAEACRRLVQHPDGCGLPPRLSVFGPTRLSAQHREVLSALAVHRDVHLWLCHPSPVLWSEVEGVLSRAVGPHPIGPRAGDPSSGAASSTLLAYLGRDVRELQLTLAATGAEVVDEDGQQAADERAGGPSTLLRRLQDDLAADRDERVPADRPLLGPDDRSIELHASHGPDRQVEVLREVLVGMLADDPTLEPRDIVVMCPDIETYAPLISATFGLQSDEQPADHPGHRLRVRLADRALRQTNPLLAALSRVLALVGSRMTASALLDLCAYGPVAHKFRFSDDELERLGDLVVASGVRWGLDPRHRAEYAMGQFGQNTWTAGLDRLLLGVTMDEAHQDFLGTALPLDDVDSSDVDLVGRLAELLARLRELVDRLERRQSLASWIQLCRAVLEQLTAVPSTDAWQVAHAYAELGGLAQAAGDDAAAELSVAEVRALLADTFRGRATRANFRTGTLTMCTMLPMRSVPHRVICLLGLDDGVFPRRSATDGDDVLAADPWVGDRDPRSEDRQLLLDAVMAAEERLVLIYSGADARTRAPKPPAVPVGALLDALDVTARTDDGRPVREAVTVRHPLQPFDAANFAPGRLVGDPGTTFSFDRHALVGALAARRPRPSSDPGPAPLSLPPLHLPDLVPLADLVRFFAHPARALLRTRAGLVLRGDDEDGPEDQIPLALDGLASWEIGDRLLRLHLEGADLDRLSAAEWRRGGLPPRAFGQRALRPVLDQVRQIAVTAAPFLAEPATGVDVLAPAGERTVAGTLGVRGDRRVAVAYSWVGAKHRLQAWVELLALTAAYPDRSWQAVTVGRGRPSLLGPVPGPWAATVLADLVELSERGLSGPLPLPPRTAAEYARARFQQKSAATVADLLDQTWRAERDASWELLYGPGVRYADLAAEVSRPDEERGDLAEGTRLGTLARRVWHPLLASEVQL